MPGIQFRRSETQGLVSIVIPTYRGEKFIGETLESIGCQTYRSWEVLVVEDASHGPTAEIVSSFARRHPSHRVDYSRNQRNGGPSHSRNVAFAQAAGEFVALVDADDRWMPEHLARSIHALETTGKDVVYSSVVMFEDQTDVLVGIWGPTPQELQDFPHGLFCRNFVTPSATVLRRQVLADVGLWNTQYRYCEDLEYWLRCVAAGKSFHHVGGCNCLYRRHANAATNHGGALQEAFAQIVERYIEMPGLRTKSCRRFASKAFLRCRHHACQ